jgi:hypothetical protein
MQTYWRQSQGPLSLFCDTTNKALSMQASFPICSYANNLLTDHWQRQSSSCVSYNRWYTPGLSVTSQWNEGSGPTQQINTRPANKSKATDRPLSSVFESLSVSAPGLSFRIVSSLYLRVNYFTCSLEGLGINLYRLHLSFSRLFLFSSNVSFAIYLCTCSGMRVSSILLQIFLQFLFSSIFVEGENSEFFAHIFVS